MKSPSMGFSLAAVVLICFAVSPSVVGGNPGALPAIEQSRTPTAHPLVPDYRIHSDGSVTQRVCFNWSCKSSQRITFTAGDMAQVAQQMALCPANRLHDRVQRLRIGIWQMEALAEKYQPLFANDKAVNDRDQSLDGRMDCIDNASNTTTYLNVLHDLGLIPGWSMEAPRIRQRFSDLVHWTAVVVDSGGGNTWSVDAWLRPNGHLPFVMPLKAWKSEKVPWDPPYAMLNPAPRYSSQFCEEQTSPELSAVQVPGSVFKRALNSVFNMQTT